MNQKNNSQLFNLTLLLDHRGLFNNGKDIISELGIGLSRKTFENKLNAALQKYDATELEYCRTNVVSHWIDNFSKYYYSTVYKMLSDGNNNVKKPALYTSYGVTYPQDIVDMSLVTQETTVLSCLPKDLFSWFLVSDLKRICSEMKGEGWWMYLAESVTEKEAVYNFPLKPFSNRNEDEEQQGALYPGFHPIAMLTANVSSNEGFVDALKFLLEREDPQQTGRYQIIHCDINVYWRYMRMMHSKWGFLEERRKTTAVMLSLWHTYQMGMRVIWEEYLSYIVAPAFHSTMGNAPMRVKTKTITMVAFLGDLACAEREARTELQRVYQAFPDSQPLKAFQQLFEFFLPVVSFFFSTERVQ
jgi:hypothetical protein